MGISPLGGSNKGVAARKREREREMISPSPGAQPSNAGWRGVVCPTSGCRPHDQYSSPVAALPHPQGGTDWGSLSLTAEARGASEISSPGATDPQGAPEISPFLSASRRWHEHGAVSVAVLRALLEGESRSFHLAGLEQDAQTRPAHSQGAAAGPDEEKALPGTPQGDCRQSSLAIACGLLTTSRGVSWPSTGNPGRVAGCDHSPLLGLSLFTNHRLAVWAPGYTSFI